MKAVVKLKWKYTIFFWSVFYFWVVRVGE